MIAKGKYILTGFCWQKCLFPGVGYHFSVSLKGYFTSYDCVYKSF